MWFLVPYHISSVVARCVLNYTYCNRWVGRGEATEWRPQSPYLNSVNFCVWGHLKVLVYSSLNDVETLHQRNVKGCHTIRNIPGILESILQSVILHVQECTESHGRHFQHLVHNRAVTRKGRFCGPIWTLRIVLLCRTHPQILYRPFGYTVYIHNYILVYTVHINVHTQDTHICAHVEWVGSLKMPVFLVTSVAVPR
jgi:hypothetical protein